MNEWAIVTPQGQVHNIVMTSRPTGPRLTPFEVASGYRAIRVDYTTQEQLGHYRFWSVRP